MNYNHQEAILSDSDKLEAQAEATAKYCTKTCLDFINERNTKEILVCSLVHKPDGSVRARNDLSLLAEYSEKKGLYGFISRNNGMCYIGQAGEGSCTKLKDRIGQELRLYNKTSNGNNGCTLSKNIQVEEKMKFSNEQEYKNHIASWKIRILAADSFDVSTELIELFLIELMKPKLNKRGRWGQDPCT